MRFMLSSLLNHQPKSSAKDSKTNLESLDTANQFLEEDKYDVIMAGSKQVMSYEQKSKMLENRTYSK